MVSLRRVRVRRCDACVAMACEDGTADLPRPRSQVQVLGSSRRGGQVVQGCERAGVHLAFVWVPVGTAVRCVEGGDSLGVVLAERRVVRRHGKASEGGIR